MSTADRNRKITSDTEPANGHHNAAVPVTSSPIEISENERQLSLLANAMPQVVFMANSEGEVTYFNDRVSELAGVERLPNGTWSWHGMLHPDDAEDTLRGWFNALSKGIPYEKEQLIQMKGGQYRWHLNRAIPQRNEKNEVVKWFGTATDIHEQKMTSEQLKDSEQRFRLMADLMPQMVWTARPDGYTDYYNKRWYEYTGMVEGVGGDPSFLPILHPDDVERCLSTWYHSVQTETPYEIEYRFRDHANPGNYRWFLGRALPVRDNEKKIVKWFGTCTDIDDQKTFVQRLESIVAERTEQLRHEKDFIETIINSSNDIIAVIDPELRYLSGNTRMEQHYGVTRNQYLGKKVTEVFPNVEGTLFINDLKEAMHGKAVLQRAYKSSVTSRWYQNSLIPLRESDGEVYGVLIIGHDITEVMTVTETIRQFNETLQEKNMALERSNRELESFNYIASHDLQEPLRKIQTFIELLQTTEGDPKSKDVYYDKIRTSAKRMSQLIRSVLTYSKISASPENFEAVDLNQVLENVKSDFELMIQEKKAFISNDRLPVINAVPIQMHQLFSNLISNSLKFSKDAPAINITVQRISGEMAGSPLLLPGQEYLQLCFNDNGIGFEQKFSEQVFHLFQRLHGKDEYSGTGIGLSIVKKIVTSHGGIISAASQPGKGTSFLIWLPWQMVREV